MLPNHTSLVWNQPGVIPELGEHDIHVWAARLDEHIDRLSEYRALLSDREQSRVSRLRVARTPERYILSRGILRRLLQRYSGQPSSSLAFQFGPKGKPSLRPIGGKTLSFNNTDSADLAIYAFAWNRELGVDVERRPRRVRAERISRRRFADSEAACILSQAADQIDNTFLSCWTRKEAWGKAIGTGIHYPMRDVILCEQMSKAIIDINDSSSQWRLMQFNVDEASTACLVAQHTDWQVRAFNYSHDHMKFDT